MSGFPFELEPHQVLPELSDKYIGLDQEEAGREFFAMAWTAELAYGLMHHSYQMGARDASALIGAGERGAV